VLFLSESVLLLIERWRCSELGDATTVLAVRSVLGQEYLICTVTSLLALFSCYSFTEIFRKNKGKYAGLNELRLLFAHLQTKHFLHQGI
jgi:hypothetical protein